MGGQSYRMTVFRRATILGLCALTLGALCGLAMAPTAAVGTAAGAEPGHASSVSFSPRASLTGTGPHPAYTMPHTTGSLGDWIVGASAAQTTYSGFDGIQMTANLVALSTPPVSSGNWDIENVYVWENTSVGVAFDFGYAVGQTAAGAWGPYPFYSWGTSGGGVSCTQPLSLGNNLFEVLELPGGTWDFTVDGNPISGPSLLTGGTCTGATLTGSLSLPGSTAVEGPTYLETNLQEEASNRTTLWTFPTLTLPHAMDLQFMGAWATVGSAIAGFYTSTGAIPTFGVNGRVQNTSLPDDELLFSSSALSPPTGSSLWNGLVATIGTFSPTAQSSGSYSVSISGGTAPYHCVWRFGDGGIAAGQTVNYSYSQAGTYTLVVFVNDSSGEAAVATTSVIVQTGVTPLDAVFSAFIGLLFWVLIIGLIAYAVHRSRKRKREAKAAAAQAASRPAQVFVQYVYMPTPAASTAPPAAVAPALPPSAAPPVIAAPSGGSSPPMPAQGGVGGPSSGPATTPRSTSAPSDARPASTTSTATGSRSVDSEGEPTSLSDTSGPLSFSSGRSWQALSISTPSSEPASDSISLSPAMDGPATGAGASKDPNAARPLSSDEVPRPYPEPTTSTGGALGPYPSYAPIAPPPAPSPAPPPAPPLSPAPVAPPSPAPIAAPPPAPLAPPAPPPLAPPPPSTPDPVGDQVRAALRSIWKERAEQISGNPRMLRAILSDECPGSKREINLVVAALDDGAVDELRSAMRPGAPPPPPLTEQLVQRLMDHRGFTYPLARWAVDSWVAALL